MSIRLTSFIRICDQSENQFSANITFTHGKLTHKFNIKKKCSHVPAYREIEREAQVMYIEWSVVKKCYESLRKVEEASIAYALTDFCLSSNSYGIYFYAVLILLLHALNFFYNIKSHRWSKVSKKVAENIKKTCWHLWERKKCLCEMSCKASLSSSSDISLNLRFHEEKKFCSVSNFFTVRRRWWRRKKKEEMMRKRSKYKVIKITKQRGVRERAFFM